MQIDNIPLGFCQCGCGQKTKISSENDSWHGWVKGQPRSFVNGHHGKGKTGAKSSRWKGGKAKNGHGYIKVLSPSHPRANKDGYVLEHILVVEANIGPLSPEEIPHHINGIRDDNRPENLMVFPNRAEHQRYHERLRAFDACGHWDYRKCPFCKKYDDISNLTRNGNNYYHSICHNVYRRERREANPCASSNS